MKGTRKERGAVENEIENLYLYKCIELKEEEETFTSPRERRSEEEDRIRPSHASEKKENVTVFGCNTRDLENSFASGRTLRLSLTLSRMTAKERKRKVASQFFRRESFESVSRRRILKGIDQSRGLRDACFPARGLGLP